MARYAFEVPRLTEDDGTPRLRRAIEALKHLQGSGGVRSGLYADLGAAGVAGRQFWASNSSLLYLDSGSEWLAVHPRTFRAVTPPYPLLSGFTQVNFAANVTASQAGADVYLHDPANATLALRGLFKTAPTRPYTITAAFLSNAFHPTSVVGLFWRQSSDGKLAGLFGQNEAAAFQIYSGKFTDPATFSASYGNFAHMPGLPFYLRINETTTDRIVSFSNDGVNFQTYQSVGRTDFLTATQVGICWASQTANLNAGFHWLDWTVT